MFFDTCFTYFGNAQKCIKNIELFLGDDNNIYNEWNGEWPYNDGMLMIVLLIRIDMTQIDLN